MNLTQIEIVKKQQSVMKKYNELFNEVNELIVALQSSLTKENATIDWLHYMVSEDVDKSFRLAAALHYVEEPSDKKIVSALKENIKINKTGIVKKLKK